MGMELLPYYAAPGHINPMGPRSCWSGPLPVCSLACCPIPPSILPLAGLSPSCQPPCLVWGCWVPTQQSWCTSQVHIQVPAQRE